MKTLNENASGLFSNGYNCSQAVLCAGYEQVNIDKNSALKLAAAFGGGIARNQKVCGAVTGGLMAIGLKYGKGTNDSDDCKMKTYEMSNRFIAEFKEKYGSIDCIDLVGHDMNTEEGKKKMAEEKTHERVCKPIVLEAVNMVDKILSNEG
ncbi:MAG: C-GCAxxG-C-C family protein [Bacteroidales bacterium]|nr:C-GCAxxG-C-C family protein [Bacteroidales bacterium]